MAVSMALAGQGDGTHHATIRPYDRSAEGKYAAAQGCAPPAWTTPNVMELLAASTLQCSATFKLEVLETTLHQLYWAAVKCAKQDTP